MLPACQDILACLLTALLLGACSSSLDDSRAQTVQPEEALAPAPDATETPRTTPTPDGTQPPTTPVPIAAEEQVEASPLKSMGLVDAFPNLTLNGMVALAYPDDGTERLYVALQPGRIMAFANERDVTSAAEFLDIRGRVSDRGNEEGLLGIAFDPDFAVNGYLYVYYSAANPRRSVVSRFYAGGGAVADADSERVVLEVGQPFSNHNGGQIAFGPDGYLYIGLGDGGSGGDPRGNGQDPGTLLGTILRIDVAPVDSEGSYAIPPDNPFADASNVARPEIFAYGLRNPWRFSFDSETGALWAGDVGQNRYEEIDLILPGLNYGWNVMEGFECFSGSGCDQADLTAPVISYDHSEGCSVSGGYVYRGARLPSLYGAYIYGDFCSGNVWALRHNGSGVTEHMEIVGGGPSVPTFGQDQTGEVFLLSFNGTIYRFEER